VTQTSAVHAHTHTHLEPSGSYLLFCLQNCGWCVLVAQEVRCFEGELSVPQTKTVSQSHPARASVYIYTHV